MAGGESRGRRPSRPQTGGRCRAVAGSPPSRCIHIGDQDLEGGTVLAGLGSCRLPCVRPTCSYVLMLVLPLVRVKVRVPLPGARAELCDHLDPQRLLGITLHDSRGLVLKHRMCLPCCLVRSAGGHLPRSTGWSVPWSVPRRRLRSGSTAGISHRRRGRGSPQDQSCRRRPRTRRKDAERNHLDGLDKPQDWVMLCSSM